MCVFCSFLLFSNSSCFVFLFQTKKKRKKNIVALTQYSRARIFPHTLFDFKKLQVSRQDLYFSQYKKLSLSLCLLALRAIPAIYHAFRCPCYREKISLSVCLKHSDWPAIETHCRNRRERGRFRFFSNIPSDHPLPHGGGHRSSQVGTHVRRCPRLRLLRIRRLCVCGRGRNLLSFCFGSATAIHESFAFRTRKLSCLAGVCLLQCVLSRPSATADSIPDAAARGNNDVSVGGGLFLQHCALLLLLFGDYFSSS